jgi:ubiquinone biosynthesis accessory factor UbiJ
MLKPMITRFLQHITSQNQWSKTHLQPFAGKVVRFDFVLAKADLLILEDGSLAPVGETAAPNATIHIAPSLALRMMAKDDAAKIQIKIDGDTHLATEVSKILQLMRWDVEEDLSHVVGDIAASKVGKISQKTFHEAKKQSVNLAEMLAEYWQEERPILAKKRHVEQFNADVDALRSDMARFEKRLEKLAKSLESKSQ